MSIIFLSTLRIFYVKIATSEGGGSLHILRCNRAPKFSYFRNFDDCIGKMTSKSNPATTVADPTKNLEAREAWLLCIAIAA